MPPDSGTRRRLPSWLLYGTVAASGLLAFFVVGALAFTTLAPESDVLPDRWRAWLDHVASEGEIVQPPADPAPPWVATKPEHPPHGPPADGTEATAALLPIEAAVDAADKAIAAYRESRGDLKLAMAAQEAVDAIRRIAVNVHDDAATQAAVVEVRDEKATKRQHVLEDARRMARTTHEVTGTRNDPESPYLVLRAAAHPLARDLGHLDDGDRVHVFLATDSGWARVEVLAGPGTGQVGYVRSKSLKPLSAPGAAK